MSPSKGLTIVFTSEEFDVSHVSSSVAEAVFIQVGGGLVTLLSYMLS